jgi:AcrR family transcriptional regulator
MQARPLRRRPPRSDVREAVLSAAWDVFRRRGYERATLAEVARTAGYTKGAVYSNFEGKDGLMLELLRRNVGERVGVVRARAAELDPASDWRHELARIAVEELERANEWTRLFLDFWSRAAAQPSLRAALAEVRQEMQEDLASALADLPELGVPAPVLARTIFALANGLTIEAAIDGEPLDLAPYAPVIERMLKA